jgi:hypothetical protein
VWLNPFNRSDCPRETSDFLTDAGNLIIQESRDKTFVFFGDFDHFTSDPYSFLFSRTILAALQQAGIKHLILERQIEEQPFLDAIAKGTITPEQCTQIMSHLYDSSHPESQENDLAEGVSIAASMGVHVHCNDMREAFISPTQQLRYHYLATEKNKAWLAYTQKNPDFFEKPEQLIQRIIKDNAARYAKKGIDLSGHLLTELQKGEPPQKIIVRHWVADNKGKFPDLSSMLNVKNMGTAKHLTDEKAIAALLTKRQKLDKNVFARIDKLRAGEKAAVFCGLAHIRNINSGFTRGLSPDQYTVFQLFSGIKPQEFATSVYGTHLHNHFDPTDHMVFVDQRVTTSYSNVMAKRPAAGLEAPQPPQAPKVT